MTACKMHEDGGNDPPCSIVGEYMYELQDKQTETI